MRRTAVASERARAPLLQRARDRGEQQRVACVLEGRQHLWVAAIQNALRLEKQQNAPRLWALAPCSPRLQPLIRPLDREKLVSPCRVLIRVVPPSKPPVRPLEVLLCHDAVFARSHLEHRACLGLCHRQRLAGKLRAPCFQQRLQQRDVVDDGPVGKAVFVAEVSQVVAVAPQLVAELGVFDGWAGREGVLRVAVLAQLG